MIMDTRMVLEAARDLIAYPSRWTDGVNARDAYGNPCEPGSCDAVRWCANGALIRVSWEATPWRAIAVLDAVAERNDPDDYWSLSCFNDMSGHAEVLDLFDRAIAATPPAPRAFWNIGTGDPRLTGWETVGPSDCTIASEQVAR